MPKNAMKLLRRLSRFRSIPGVIRLLSCGPSVDSGGVNSIAVLLRSGIAPLWALRLLFLLIERSIFPSSFVDLSSSSISPSVVRPFVPRFSSVMGENRTTPRLAEIPRLSWMNCCTKAVVRLFFVGASSDARAETDNKYAGSKDPPNRRRVESCTVRKIHDSGR